MKRVFALSRTIAKMLPITPVAVGCGGPPDPSGFLARADVATPLVQPVTGADPSGESAGISEALLMLPPEAGGMTRIRERHFPNGTRQEIVLGGAPQGENVIDVSIRTRGSDQVGRGMLQIGRPSERGVRSETMSRFPDVRMSIVTRPLRNALGDFGLAIGRHANGSRCVFAWQWIEDIRETSPHVSSFAKMSAMFSPDTTSVSIRIRLCRNGVTVDDLAGLIEGLQLGDPSAMDRVMRLDRRSYAAGGAAQDIGGGGAVAPVGSLESALGSPPRAAAPELGQAAAPKPVAKQGPVKRAAPKPARKVVAQPQRKAVAKPARVAKRPPPKSAPAAQAPRSQPQFEPGGPRYMAPMEDATLSGSVSSIVPRAPSRQLDPSLPAAAYRGPGAARGMMGAATQPMR